MKITGVAVIDLKSRKIQGGGHATLTVGRASTSELVQLKKSFLNFDKVTYSVLCVCVCVCALLLDPRRLPVNALIT